MYREICQTDLSEFHSTIWEKSPKVSTKYILLCCMAVIAIFLQRILLKNSLRVRKRLKSSVIFRKPKVLCSRFDEFQVRIRYQCTTILSWCIWATESRSSNSFPGVHTLLVSRSGWGPSALSIRWSDIRPASWQSHEKIRRTKRIERTSEEPGGCCTI